MDHLQRFEFVRLVEDFERDVRRSVKMLALPLRGPIPMLNRASRKRDWNTLTRDEQGLLEQGLQLDFALYAIAVSQRNALYC